MKYYILAERTNLEGFPEQFNVSIDNTATDDFDSILFFDSKDDAEKWTESDQAKEWKNCSFEIVETENA